MAMLIQKIVRLSNQVFSQQPVSGLSLTENIAGLQDLFSKLRAKDVGFDTNLTKEYVTGAQRRSAPVTCVDIYNSPHFTVVMFVLKNNSRIPLHDHPGMNGLLKVVYGSVKITSYSNPDKLHKSLVSPPRDLITKYKFPKSLRLSPVIPSHDPLIVDSESDSILLTSLEGNYHEIVSLDGPAAFVDILSPPYDPTGERDCHYYHDIGGSMIDIESKNLHVRWLSEIECPEDFWCDGSVYKGPEIKLNKL